MVIKIGIDVHGMLDKRPHFWVAFAKSVHNHGGKIYIVTGKSWGRDIEEQLLGYNNGEKWWDEYFSIDDHLRCDKKLDHFIDYKGGRSYSEEEWNRAKSVYCREECIDIMFDDSPRYGTYFETPYFQVGERKETPESRKLEDKIVNLTIQLESQAKLLKQLQEANECLKDD